MGRFIELASGMIKTMLGLPEPWKHSIRKFERLDALNHPEPGCVVFTGSSSFTLWSSLERDMAPLRVVNRGFGGALIDDVVRYADRIVLPYFPSAVVVFAGTNDIAGKQPASPGYIEERFAALVNTIHLKLPNTRIFYVAITPSRARWNLWPVASEANHRIMKKVEADERLGFIDLGPQLLGDDGLPNSLFYRLDRLHPSKQGYALWTKQIRSVLLADPEVVAAAKTSE